MTCPRCRSDALSITTTPYSGAMDMATGYVDAGEDATYRCLDCDLVGDDVEGDLLEPRELVAK